MQLLRRNEGRPRRDGEDDADQAALMVGTAAAMKAVPEGTAKAMIDKIASMEPTAAMKAVPEGTAKSF